MDIGQLEVGVHGMEFDERPARLEQLRRMEPNARKQLCFAEKRCFYCKRVVGSPPSHTANNCPVKKSNTASSNYPLCQHELDLTWSSIDSTFGAQSKVLSKSQVL